MSDVIETVEVTRDGKKVVINKSDLHLEKPAKKTTKKTK